ncbi:MAG TPA: hypothetical protein VI583_15580 [Cyclobacteriaceae bacterium]|nr:hypothetical protein [Cyclobacteriaceae bacterium]
MDQVLSKKELSEELKSHDFKLITYTSDEIRIKGISGISPFVIIVMSFLGLCLIVFGIISIFVIQNPEYIAGTLLILAGIALVFLPYYNYYSKSYFELNFSRNDKCIMIKKFNPFPQRQIIKFDEISSLKLLKNTLSTYVDDTTKGSYIYSFAVSLNLKNQDNLSLIQFSKRDEKIESFSVRFTDILTSITGIPKEFESVT